MGSNNKIATTTATYIDRAKKLHKETYDYSQCKFIGWSKPVTLICQVHGKFKLTARVHVSNGTGCSKCHPPGIFNGVKK